MFCVIYSECFAAAISLFFLLVTSVWAVIVMRNFGRGLKIHRECAFLS